MTELSIITAHDQKVLEFLRYLGVPNGWKEVHIHIYTGEALEIEETRYPLRDSASETKTCDA